MIPITKPTLSSFKRYETKIREAIEGGFLTNGRNVAELEEKIARRLEVKNCIAVSSCTSGLMLVMKLLGLKGEIILPSFTFSATGHAALWNNLTPVFADVKEDTFEIDPASVVKLITNKTSAILATHIFGNPCCRSELEGIARKYKLKLIFDAAHALGASLKGRMIGGFGDAEIFSCSPTKLLTTAEGGFVTTDNDKLARLCRIGRNYGDDGSYNTIFNGLNARMSEIHAIIGLESLRNLDRNIHSRNRLAAYFCGKLKKIDPHLEFQKINDGAVSTYKDFSVMVSPALSGYRRDDLHKFLLARGIMTKKYFYPPLHLQKTYEKYGKKYRNQLPITDKISNNILCLPMFSHLTREEADFIIETIKEFYDTKKRS